MPARKRKSITIAGLVVLIAVAWIVYSYTKHPSPVSPSTSTLSSSTALIEVITFGSGGPVGRFDPAQGTYCLGIGLIISQNIATPQRPIVFLNFSVTVLSITFANGTEVRPVASWSTYYYTQALTATDTSQTYKGVATFGPFMDRPTGAKMRVTVFVLVDGVVSPYVREYDSTTLEMTTGTC